jgi:hypothetical protein
MSWFTKKKSSKPSPTNSTKRLPRCPAIKRERPAHTYLLHYYSIPPHPLLLFFLQKKNSFGNFSNRQLHCNTNLLRIFTPQKIQLHSLWHTTIFLENNPLPNFYYVKKSLYFSHGSYFFATICSNSRSEKKKYKKTNIFLIHSKCPKVPTTKQ